MKDLNSACELLDHSSYVDTAVLTPIGIKNEGGLLGIKLLDKVVEEGSAILEFLELEGVVVVGELEAVLVINVGKSVELVDKLIKSREIVSSLSGHTSDTDIGSAKSLMLCYGELYVAGNSVPGIVSTAEGESCLIGSLLQELCGELMNDCRVNVGISHSCKLFESNNQFFLGVEMIANRECLKSKLFHLKISLKIFNSNPYYIL